VQITTNATGQKVRFTKTECNQLRQARAICVQIAKFTDDSEAANIEAMLGKLLNRIEERQNGTPAP